MADPGPSAAVRLGAAAATVVAAVILGAARSRRTGVEVGLVALALLLSGLRAGGGAPPRLLGAAMIVSLLAVLGIAVEPHLH